VTARGQFCGIVRLMNTRAAIATALLLAIAPAGAGCGSGGAAKGEGGVPMCQPTASGAGTMSWLDDGTSECGDAVATFSDNMLGTTFSLTGTAATIRVDINISTPLGPRPIGGTYGCAPVGSMIATFSYTQGQANVFAQICEFTVNMQGTAGVRATGTFSATLALTGGATKAITNGAFDAPVTFIGTGN